MASGHNKPRKLDYVHFTRVDNSASIRSTPTNRNSTSSSRNIFTKFKMMSPDVGMKMIAVAVITAIIITVAVAITVAFILAGSRSLVGNRTAAAGQSELSVMESATLTTSTLVWISSTKQPTISTSPPSTVTVVTTKQSTQPACQSSEFLCSDMTCISLELVCNGIPDCADASDEKITCACKEDQFRCPSGQCVPSSAVCNEVYDCLDKGDESNCPDCTGFRCQSNNVCLWDRMASRCNQVFDCEDYSDELNCSKRSGRHLCSNGVQINLANVCNGLDDCGDNSDEQNCTCKEKKQFACSGKRGKCIPSTWVCDGHPDCQNGTDEKNCDMCGDGDFRCADYTCMNSSVRCDGKVDCAVAGGDEDGCVELTPLNELRVMVEGDLLPVCADGWTDVHSTWVCSSLHTRAVLSWTGQPSLAHETRFAVMKDSQAGTGIEHFQTTDACQSQAIVHIHCQESECGQRKIDVLESYVAGGSIAPLGKWPWVVSLAYLDKPICGAVLIGTRWALTAAHCVMYPVESSNDYSRTPFYFSVTAGAVMISANTTLTTATTSNNYWESQQRAQVVRVSKIIFHPKRILLDSGGVDWDIALLQLESDVRMSDLVQPVCLPSQAQVFLPTSYCYLAGWGLLSSRQHLRSSRLRDTRMQLWSESRCSSNTVIGEAVVNTNSTLCAGYLFGRPTACQGDSGGPLMCLDSVSGRYILAGIVSRGSSRCGQTHPYTHSNRFAKVAMAATWIYESIR